MRISIFAAYTVAPRLPPRTLRPHAADPRHGRHRQPPPPARPLTASPLVTLREFDCKHLQAAFTHTEEYFTALDTFLKAH